MILNKINNYLVEGFEKDKDLLKAIKMVMVYAKQLENSLKTKDQKIRRSQLKSGAQRAISQLEIIIDGMNSPDSLEN
jgi:transcriptional regulator of heat shock response